MSSSAVLTVRNLSKAYGPRTILSDVSFTLGPDTRMGVVAPNGTGKTTLLRLIARLDSLDAGTIALAPPEATVGYLPQEPERRPDETLRDFLRRRTGVAAAVDAFEQATESLAAGDAGAADTYSDALDRYLSLGAADFDARCGEVCADVGLPDRMLDVPMTGLSGGQAARASLAAILLSRFDIFLLDEPTNDLDFAGLEQLERFLLSLTSGVLLVSHDRAFLERCVSRVLEIDEVSHTATEFGGGYLAYLDEKATTRRHGEEAYTQNVAQRSALKERAQQQRQWADVGVRKQKKMLNDEPDRTLRSRRIERTEKQAGKVRATERALDRLGEVEKPFEGWELRMNIGQGERSGDVVARLTGAVMERGDFRLGPMDVEIGFGERIAITGANGSGKSTLLQAILGRLSLTAGERWFGPGVVVGELDQARALFDAERPLADVFVDASGLLMQESRSLLAKFGLGAEHVRRPARSLSPGERTRAVLALLMARETNCLVLDEPTNHLDLPAIEQLEQALETFDGTVLLVTHDRRLLDAVRITRTIAL